MEVKSGVRVNFKKNHDAVNILEQLATEVPRKGDFVMLEDWGMVHIDRVVWVASPPLKVLVPNCFCTPAPGITFR